MKLLYLFLIFVFSVFYNNGYACSCVDIQTFCETITFGGTGEIDPNLLIVRATKRQSTAIGMEIDLIDIFHGEESRTVVEVRKGNGADCGVNTDQFRNGEELLLALWRGGADDVYGLSICGVNFLSIRSGGIVSGAIAPGIDLLPLAAFSELDQCGQLDPEGFNFPNAVFPSLTSDNTNLLMEVNVPITAQIQVYDASGRRVSQNTVNFEEGRITHIIPMSNLAAGLYFIRVQVGSQRKVYKVVKV